MGMINETERDNRSMYLHYMIENLENGLKYVSNEAKIDSRKWEFIKKTIEDIDAKLERLVVLVKTENMMDEVQTRYDDEVKGIRWVRAE